MVYVRINSTVGWNGIVGVGIIELCGGGLWNYGVEDI